VCDICPPQLIIAAHICGKAAKGSDDWRNGIPLCATHHEAFDNHFFGIDPTTRVIQCQPGLKPADIGLLITNIQPIKNVPHIDALKWRWEVTQKQWKEDV
jgi:hypothetical protein